MTTAHLVRGVALSMTLQAIICLSASAGNTPRTIHEIIALAEKHSPELVALDRDASAKRALSQQAGSMINPTIELQGSIGTLTGSPEQRGAAFAINQELPLNDKLQLRRDAGQREADAVQRQRDNALRLLRSEVTVLVLETLLADKRRDLTLQLVELNRELHSVAGERFKSGDIPELELNLAGVELARAESRLLEIGRERLALRIRIAALTGLGVDSIAVTADTGGTAPNVKSADLVKRALSARPDLKALVLERERAGIEHRLARAEALPNLTAGLFAQWQRTSVEVGGLSAVNSDTQLGLRFSMPLPVFDRNQGGRTAAQARLEAADSRRLALERAITAEVESAAAQLSSSGQILNLFETGIIPQLTENLKLTREAYRLGEVGILAVIDEQRKFYEVSDSYLTALHGRRLAQTRLETAVAADLDGGAQ